MTPLFGGDAVEHGSLYQTSLPWLVHSVLSVMWHRFFPLPSNFIFVFFWVVTPCYGGFFCHFGKKWPSQFF
jgi:hypothetical protein